MYMMMEGNNIVAFVVHHHHHHYEENGRISGYDDGQFCQIFLDHMLTLLWPQRQQSESANAVFY